MSRRIVVAAALSFAALAPAVAVAADLEGIVQSVDATERTVTLDNGTKLWLSDDVAVDSVKAGAAIKISYEEKDGKPVAITIEMK
jgi:Protein of unknown function (DUF1344)